MKCLGISRVNSLSVLGVVIINWLTSAADHVSATLHLLQDQITIYATHFSE